MRCLQLCSYKYNDALMWYLQFCSDTYTYWNLGNKHDEEYSLLKHDRFCLLFICLCFSLKQASILQRILLIVHVLFSLDSKQTFSTSFSFVKFGCIWAIDRAIYVWMYVCIYIYIYTYIYIYIYIYTFVL